MNTNGNIFIVDASGSMQERIDGSASKTKIEIANTGLRGELNSIKTDSEEGVIDYTEVWSFEGRNITNHMKNMGGTNLNTEITIGTGGMTNLYDCICHVCDNLPTGLDGGIINIYTDGMENHSTKFTLEDVKKRIKALRDKNWLVTFSGADENSLKQAQDMGISKGNTVRYDNSRGMSKVLKAASGTRSMYRSKLKSKSLNRRELESTMAMAFAGDEDVSVSQ